MFIVAGNYSQAQGFARRIELSPREWVYLSGAGSFHGYRGNNIVYVGTYYERRDLGEIYNLARMCEFVEVEATDLLRGAESKGKLVEFESLDGPVLIDPESVGSIRLYPTEGPVQSEITMKSGPVIHIVLGSVGQVGYKLFPKEEI